MASLVQKTEQSEMASNLPEARTRSHLSLGKSLPNSLFNSLNLFGADQSPLRPATDSIQQFKPIFKGRFLYQLPLIETALPSVKLPPIAYVMSVDLQPLTVLVGANPADFSLGHCVVR